jgi:uncharacterized membrane protein YpjA
MMNKYLKITLFGFLTWLVPFVASFFFYTRSGALIIGEGLFKSIMIVLGSVTGAILLAIHFRKVADNYLRTGIFIGLSWFAINIVLDFLFLIPMSHMAVGAYFSQIGLRYLTIPITSIAIGFILQQREERSQGIGER